MSGRLGRMLFSMGACALLVSFGCGEAPAVEPAEGLKQTRQALSTGADVLVQSVSGPSSALPEGPLELQVGVCNQGPEPTGIFVSGFLSPSSAIPSPDTEVIEISSGYTWLMPGECSSGPLPSHGYVLPEGAWYLGARATGDWYEDPNPSNNARIGNRIGIGTAPDFLVQTVSGPVSVTPGAPFTASVTVCNPGTVSGGTDVQLVLSRDTTITFSPSAPESQQDLPLASFASGTLEPGQCATQQLPTSVQPSREGNWYLGAVADPANAVPELIETNNTRASKAVGIGYRPDFTVQSVSSPSNLVPGGPFTSSVKVCNQGTVSGSTQVQLVLSEDTTIRFSPTGDPALQDLPLASFASGTLAAGQCAVQQVQASAQPPHDGSWYLGAVADPANTTLEFSESNNTRASKAVGIGYQPDFLIQTVSSPPSVLPGVPFTASVKVCNQGTASGDAQVLLVLSEDTTIRFSPMGDPALQDWPLTSFDTGPLAAGECTTQQVETSVVPPFDASNWYLGALADPDNTVPEFNETNNTRASGALNIGYWPDFIVQSVSGPVSLAPGDAFTVSVKVCNQGTVAGDFYLEVFLSSDREISELDSHVGTGYPEYGNWWLEPGQCLSKPVSATATVSEGAWYVGALVRGSWEFVETNNARAGGLLHVGYQPDYVIQSVSGPEVAAPGSSITASVKVCNQGTVAGGDVQVQLVLSEDTLIRFSSGTPPAEQDLPLASFSAGPLAPGQCQTQEVQATVQPPHEGLWYLGAVADPGNQESEFNEDNNTRAGKALGIGHQPDFIIQAVSGPASLVPGDVLTASLTVCNQGTEGSGGTEVQLVLSEDSTIRFSPSGSPAEQDLPLAAFASGTLAAGQCKTQQVQASVSAPHEGVWYLGAVADPSGSVLELLETNNVRASKPVGIGHQPDLVVQAVRAPLSAWYGTSVTIPVTVCNQGTAGSGDTQVQLIVSEDTILHIDPNELPWEQDVLLTTLPVGPLAAGQCTTQQVQIEVRAWNESTWYYLGAVVDPDNSTGEFLETNNTRVSARFYFGYQPDLMVQAVSAPVSLLPGEEFTASVTVCNQGSGVVPGSYLELVLSEDTLIHSSLSGAPAEQDLSLAVVEVWWLAPGQCTTQQVQTSVQPPHEGAWYLGAVADAFNSEAEFNEDNNTRASKPVGIGYQPDYIIRAVSGPASVSPGAPFTASVTVCNQGAASASSAQVQLVLSEDSTIHFSPNGSPEEQDLPLASFSAGPLAVGQCTTQQVHASVQPSHEGTWYLGAVADPANDVPELLESNNALASKPFGLGHQPDFVIQAVSGPVSVLPGAPFTASVTVCNQGTEGSGGTEVQLVLSEDSTLRLPTTGSPAEQDLLLVSFASGPLAAGQCATQQVETQVQPSHEGAWYLGAVADPANAVPELLETNNTRTSKPVGIGQRADIVIQAVSGPLNTQAYQSFLAEVTVCNQGTAAGWADGHLLLSRDTHFDNSSELPQHEQDFTLGTFWAGLLEPGQCATLPVEAWAGTGEERSWYLGAVADPSNYVEELNETNNTRSGGLIGIGYRADYIVKAVNAPVSVVPGEQFMASVTVCNQGNAWGGGTDVQLVLSGDATIQFASGSTSAAQDLPLNSFFLGVLEEGQCRTQQVQASAQPPHEGTWYLGAVVDPGNAEHELNEDNNTRASEPLGFGHRPDFVIQAVSGPANARLGAPLTASVTVCNQGTVSGGADVQLVLSEDSTIRYAPSAPWEEQDLPLVSFASETLAPGQCAAQQVQTNAQPPHEGLWYLGAVADPGNAVPEFFEDNNTRASTALAIGDQPDFVIQSVSIPPSVLPGAPFAASVTVCNEGTVSSGTDVQLVLSEDATVVSSSTGAPEEQDLLLSSFASGTLAAGQCRTQQVQLSVQPPHEGAWYLGAVADLANTVPEFLELNNGGVSKPLGIGVRPDFIVQAVSGPASAEGYSSFIMKVTVCNQGTLAGSTGGHLVLSRDSTVESSPVPPPGQGDVLIGYLSTVALEPGQCVTQEAQTGTPGVDGDWYLGAVVDADNTEPELNETNNGRAGRIISLGYKPDYIIQAVSGPTRVVPGEPFTASVTVCNQGTRDGWDTQVVLVLSEDASIHFSPNALPAGQDLLLGSFSPGLLGAGQCQTQQVETHVQPPHEGTWYLGAVADPADDTFELNEANNSRASHPVGVGHRPDFLLQAVSGPASISPGVPFAASVKVCNQGTVGGDAQVQLVLSEDATISFTPNGSPEEQDLPLTSFASGLLEPGQCTTQQVQASVQPPHEGAWYLGAVADPANAVPELIETNNTRASKLLGLGSQPDFVIQEVSGPPSVLPGQPLMATVKVCNQGTMSSGTDVQLVLSQNTTIH
ncbi:CARDB domain-containing protein, partial [Hyalangium sp.]|uniref:CARDB domain-containing protein n=1 Tax=Hyalangium sp. TaxID=2028555 RepID=UPI002D43132C